MDRREPVEGHLVDEQPGSRERVLAAAAELFADRGYAGTSVREVCEAAGVTKPTLYYYFGSKGGLAEALLSDAAGDLLAALQGVAAGPQPLRVKLKDMARIIFERSGQAPKTCRFLYASLFAPQDAVPAYDFDTMMPQIVALTAAVFRESGCDGTGSPGDPEFSAMALLGVLQAYIMRFVRKQDVELTADLADRIVDAVLDGLAAKPTRENGQ